jgi:hypothetical protein
MKWLSSFFEVYLTIGRFLRNPWMLHENMVSGGVLAMAGLWNYA